MHPAHRMVKVGRTSSYRVQTLCNHLLSHYWTDILQTFQSCDGHIEDFHVTFWKCSDIFKRKLHVHVLTLVIFPACFELTVPTCICVINSAHTIRLTFIKLCVVVTDTLKM
jgi:hypothetical protein